MGRGTWALFICKFDWCRLKCGKCCPDSSRKPESILVLFELMRSFAERCLLWDDIIPLLYESMTDVCGNNSPILRLWFADDAARLWPICECHPNELVATLRSFPSSELLLADIKRDDDNEGESTVCELISGSCCLVSISSRRTVWMKWVRTRVGLKATRPTVLPQQSMVHPQG